jgi:hypothetical protein
VKEAFDLARSLMLESDLNCGRSLNALQAMRRNVRAEVFSRAATLLMLEVSPYKGLEELKVSEHCRLINAGFVVTNRPSRVEEVAYARGFDEVIVYKNDDTRVVYLRAGEVQAVAKIFRVAAYALLDAETLVDWLSWQFDELVKQEVA